MGGDLAEDARDQRLESDLIETGEQGPEAEDDAVFSRHQHESSRAKFGSAAETLAQAEGIAGESSVDQDQGGRSVCADLEEGFLGAGDRADAELAFLELSANEIAKIGIGVGHQNDRARRGQSGGGILRTVDGVENGVVDGPGSGFAFGLGGQRGFVFLVQSNEESARRFLGWVDVGEMFEAVSTFVGRIGSAGDFDPGDHVVGVGVGGFPEQVQSAGIVAIADCLGGGLHADLFEGDQGVAVIGVDFQEASEMFEGFLGVRREAGHPQPAEGIGGDRIGELPAQGACSLAIPGSGAAHRVAQQGLRGAVNHERVTVRTLFTNRNHRGYADI